MRPRTPARPAVLTAALAAVAALATTLLVAPAGATDPVTDPVTASANDPVTGSATTSAADRGSRRDLRGALADGARYVALGDSYSAASGVLPPDPTAPPQCLRSTLNYPHLIAERTGARLVDVTCGGAETGDYAEGQYPGVAPQLDALGRGTRLVTMTIGGNDSGVFIGSILSCGALGVLSLGQGSPCKDQFGSSYEDTIRDTTYPAIVKVLRQVGRRAPRAEVAILGYPWILPRTGGCFDQMPVAEGDVPYLRSLQATLNDAVRRAAAATGSTYVNLNRVSEGHDACQEAGVRWIEPVLQGTNPVIVHPNALGEARMAARALRVLDLAP